MDKKLSLNDWINIEMVLETRISQLAESFFNFPDVYWLEKAKELANTFRNVTGFNSPSFNKLVKRMGKYRFISWERGNPFDLSTYLYELSKDETYYGVLSERVPYDVLIFDKDLNYLGSFDAKCFERIKEDATCEKS